MGKNVIKAFGLMIFLGLLSVALLYVGLQFFGLRLTHYTAGATMPIAATDPELDFSPYPSVADTTVKNVIVFLGTGMSLNQVAATRYRYYGPDGRLHLERMPVTGIVNTFPADDSLTTSPGAAAAALATGHKTRNGLLTPLPGADDSPTLFDAARAAGYRTGMVTTSYLTGSTTAAFSGHVPSRDQQTEIAKRLLAHRFNVLFGGGNAFFTGDFGQEEGPDGIAYARQQGYTVATEKDALLAAEGDYVLGLFDVLYADRYSNEVRYAPDIPTLAACTKKALALLKGKDNGFVLVIEEEGISYGGRRNWHEYLTSHVKLLDDAVEVAIEFALQDRQTLVLVMADLEAGGLTFAEGNRAAETLELRWSTAVHTGAPVPLFALGPHATAFTGLMDNTDVPKQIARLLGFHDFTAGFTK